VDFKIVWTLRSREDLHDIATFIAKDNPPAALKLGDMIFARVDSLEIFPELGRVVPERNQANIREIVVRVCLNNQFLGLVLGFTGLFDGKRTNNGRMS